VEAKDSLSDSAQCNPQMKTQVANNQTKQTGRIAPIIRSTIVRCLSMTEL